MYDCFYVICVDEKKDWWQLRDRDSHIVLAAGSGKEYVFSPIRTIVLRHKNKMRYIGALKSLEYGKVPRAELTKRCQEFSERGRLYDEEIHDVVREALKEVKKDVPVLKNRKLMKIVHVAEEVERTTSSITPLPPQDLTTKDVVTKRPVLCKIGSLKLK